MTQSLKDLLKLGVVLTVFVQLMSVTGIAESQIDAAFKMFELGGPTVAVGLLIADFFFLLAFSRPTAREWLICLAGAVVIAVSYEVLSPFSSTAKNLVGRFYWPSLIGMSLGFSAIGVLVVKYRSEKKSGVRFCLAKELLGAGAMAVLYATTISPLLGLTAALHPVGYDPILFVFDGLLGFQASQILTQWVTGSRQLNDFFLMIYVVIIYGFVSLYAYSVTRNLKQPINLLYFWAASGITAMVAYHLFPASGPRYYFGAEVFPAQLPSAETIEASGQLMRYAARNAFPSMHFGWTLAFVFFAALTRSRMLIWVTGVFSCLTVIATLGLGEHYLVDLVASIPFILFLLGLLSRGLPIDHPVRRRAILVGLVGYLTLLLSLRFGISVYREYPALAWLVIVAIFIVTVPQYFHLLNALRNEGTCAVSDGTLESDKFANMAEKKDRLLAFGMFFLSGLAALVYEVVFSKSLALTFGSQATATQTVLATYMGGIAIGAWLGGLLTRGKRWSPLAIYIACELGIGLYCLISPAIFSSIQSVYINWADGFAPDDNRLLLLRVLLGGASLLVPTVLMGVTFPVLANAMGRVRKDWGESVALLYGANTLGAGLGALLAGYVLLPAVGVNSAMLIAILFNLFAAALAFRAMGSGRWTGGSVAVVHAHPTVSPPVPGHGERQLGWLALLALFIGGMITLAIEVDYIHLLAVVAGNSTYAFSLMLFAFLIGLSSGAAAGRWALQREWPAQGILVVLELSLAIVLLSGVFVWTQIPDYFASYANYSHVRSFGAREFLRGVVCLIVMFPPALVIGAIYPVAMHCVGQAFPRQAGFALGSAAASNTLGNILGVLVTAFLLLPQFGALRVIHIAAALSVGLAVLLIVGQRNRLPRLAWGMLPIAAILVLQQPTSFNYTQLASGANVYFTPRPIGEVIDHAESIDGGLTTVAKFQTAEDELLTLQTNGKFQGNNAMNGEMLAQVGFGLTPLLHTSERGTALVIGYGTGVTSRTVAAAGFAEIEIAELSEDLLNLADRHFFQVNHGVRQLPHVRTLVTDGRNFLLLTNRRYDLITIEVSSIWFAGAASLYNQEFYELANRKMAKDGVLQQWIQFHHLTPTDILYILGSVRAVFSYVWLYHIGGQGMIIASNSPNAYPSLANAAKINSADSLQPIINAVGMSPTRLSENLLLGPVGVTRMLDSQGIPREYWVSNDDNMVLEYSTPRGNVLDDSATRKANLGFVHKYR